MKDFDIEEVKDKLDRLRQKEAKLEGQKQYVQNKLKEMGFKSKKAAEGKLEELKKSREDILKEKKEKEVEFMEKFGRLLDV